MKFQKAIDNIKRGAYTRAELVKLRTNAANALEKGDCDAQLVIAEIDKSIPTDKTMVFMGFCPNAEIENRLDIEWKEKGVCTFSFLDSEHQLARYNDIWPGDLIILKKTQEFGKTMRLYGYGRVTGVRHDHERQRYLKVDWSDQSDMIEVPLMGCGSTVNVKTIKQVADEMPPEFYSWLSQHDTVKDLRST